jgi:hypothetical protein
VSTVSKEVSVDKRRTTEAVELLHFARPDVPVEGFNWIKGLLLWHPDLPTPCDFLVPRPGRSKAVSLPEDLYLEFAQLTPTPKAILDFAGCWGRLGTPNWHFHGSEDRQPNRGEDLEDWCLEIRRLRDPLDLWYFAKDGDRPGVRRFLKGPGARGESKLRRMVHYPPFMIDDPIQYAKAIVIHTVNVELSPVIHHEPDCCFPLCSYKRALPTGGDDTRAYLRASKDRDPDLLIASSNLLRTLWLQFAASIAGQRKVKKCEAPDCGLYMDVTTSKHPAARRMHSQCEERLKKRRYRQRTQVGKPTMT